MKVLLLREIAYRDKIGFAKPLLRALPVLNNQVDLSPSRDVSPGGNNASSPCASANSGKRMGFFALKM